MLLFSLSRLPARRPRELVRLVRAPAFLAHAPCVARRPGRPATFSGGLSSDIGLIVRLILSPAPKPCGARALGDRKLDRQKLRHAASFAELSYASAYMRRHYPAEFFAAVLDSQPMGFYPRRRQGRADPRKGFRLPRPPYREFARSPVRGQGASGPGGVFSWGFLACRQEK